MLNPEEEKYDISQEAVNELFDAARMADYQKAEELLRNDPSLMFRPIHQAEGNELLTPLTYAFKVYDTALWKMFYEPVKHDSTLKALFIKQAQDPIDPVDLNPLFEAYETFLQAMDARTTHEISDSALDEAWRQIGTAQRSTLPIHMQMEFSRKEKTWNTNSSFEVQTRIHPKNCSIWNYDGSLTKSLPALWAGNEWGNSYSLTRGHGQRCLFTPSIRGLGLIPSVRLDLAIFRRLLETRKNDLTEFLDHLFTQEKTRELAFLQGSREKTSSLYGFFKSEIHDPCLIKEILSHTQHSSEQDRPGPQR